MRKRLVLTISILPLIFIFLSSLKVYAEESRLDKANRWLLENNIIPIERYPYFEEFNENNIIICKRIPRRTEIQLYMVNLMMIPATCSASGGLRPAI